MVIFRIHPMKLKRKNIVQLLYYFNVRETWLSCVLDQKINVLLDQNWIINP